MQCELDTPHAAYLSRSITSPSLLPLPRVCVWFPCCCSDSFNLYQLIYYMSLYAHDNCSLAQKSIRAAQQCPGQAARLPGWARLRLLLLQPPRATLPSSSGGNCDTLRNNSICLLALIVLRLESHKTYYVYVILHCSARKSRSSSRSSGVMLMLAGCYIYMQNN